MKAFSAAVLCVCVLAFAGNVRAADDDNAKKLVGTWVLSKAGGDLPEGSTVEFTKDGKLKVAIKDGSGDIKVDGTYKLEKEKITVKLKFMDQNIEESITIKKITDEVLELEDKDKKIDTFKKKK